MNTPKRQRIGRDKDGKRIPYYVPQEISPTNHRVSTEVGYFHAETPEALREKVEAERARVSGTEDYR